MVVPYPAQQLALQYTAICAAQLHVSLIQAAAQRCQQVRAWPWVVLT
jgi:hypothetical protein